ncbi:MAG: hypothetical protein V4450_12185 [Bacteroidota bacterium]
MFRNILIPLEDANHQIPAVEKAMELQEASGTTLHLVKGIRNWFSLDSLWKTRKTEAAELKMLRNQVIENIPAIHTASAVLIKRTAFTNLKKYFSSHKIDLVITDHNSNVQNNTRPGYQLPEILSRQIPAPVLTILHHHPSSLNKSVLVPITHFIPEKKVEMLLEIAQRFHSRIHIVTMLDKTRSDSKQRSDAFYQAYKQLSESGHTPEYKILLGHQSNESFFTYARQIKAGMILSNLSREPGITTEWFRARITNIFHPLPATYILTVATGLPSHA